MVLHRYTADFRVRYLGRGAGGMMMVAIAFLALNVLALTGLFAFEVGRANLAQQQLQNVVDAAALAAVATLASTDNTDPRTAHNNAIQTALNLFKQNIVMGAQLSRTTVVGTPYNNPPAGNATLYFEFLHPITRAVEPITSPNGKIVRVYGDLGVMPAFARFVGQGQFAVHSVSHGAVPKLDLVICFDISGSMDDQTPVTIRKRRWVPPPRSQIDYQVPTGAMYGTNGKIFDIMQPGPNGTSLNATPPHILSLANRLGGLFFSEVLAARYRIQGLRSGSIYPEAGLPPGNCPPGTAFAWDNQPVFTDMVVNLDNRTTFSGITVNGYSFPDIATLIEASRGNLESVSVFNSSKANTSVIRTSPRAGYKAAYFEAAKQLLQPLNDAKVACQNFIIMMNTNTDAHFGLVAFDQGIGSSPLDTEARRDIDDNQFDPRYPYGNLVNYPRPLVPLDPRSGVSGYADVNNALSSCVPIGGTNLGVAINAAVTELTSRQRPGAMRAIVLFTDGHPSQGMPLNPDPWMNARNAAVVARNAGIPVFTIGLAQDPIVVPGEVAILNDTNPDPSSGGIAAISAHGATFNLVTNSSQLKRTFEKIARCLVEIVGNV